MDVERAVGFLRHGDTDKRQIVQGGAGISFKIQRKLLRKGRKKRKQRAAASKREGDMTIGSKICILGAHTHSLKVGGS